MESEALRKMAEEALHIVTQDRNGQYGEPEDSFETIAALFTGYLSAIGYDSTTDRLKPKDAARLLQLLKMGRRITAPNKQAAHAQWDSFVDAIGYVLCEAKCSDGD